jgi:hypothetical protein
VGEWNIGELVNGRIGEQGKGLKGTKAADTKGFLIAGFGMQIAK